MIANDEVTRALKLMPRENGPAIVMKREEYDKTSYILDQIKRIEEIVGYKGVYVNPTIENGVLTSIKFEIRSFRLDTYLTRQNIDNLSVFLSQFHKLKHMEFRSHRGDFTNESLESIVDLLRSLKNVSEIHLGMNLTVNSLKEDLLLSTFEQLSKLENLKGLEITFFYAIISQTTLMRILIKIKTMKWLISLKIQLCGLENMKITIHEIMSDLSTMPELTDLEVILKRNNMTKSLNEKIKGLELPNSLKNLTIDLEDNNLGSKTFENLMDRLKTLANLESLTLNFQNNIFDCREKQSKREHSSAEIHFPSLQSLNLKFSGTLVDERFLLMLTQNYLKSSQLIKTLVLEASEFRSYNNMIKHGTSFLMICDGIGNLTHLNKITLRFQRNFLSWESYSYMSKALRNIPYLNEIEFGINAENFEESHMASFIDSICSHKNLEKLVLQMNFCHIGDKSFAYMMEQMKSLKKLKNLCLQVQDCDLTANAIEALEGMFQNAVDIRRLVISCRSNQIRGKGIEHFISRLQLLKQLRSISCDFTDNEIEELPKNAVIGLIRSNYLLRSMFFLPKKLNQDFFKGFCKCLDNRFSAFLVLYALKQNLSTLLKRRQIILEILLQFI